MWTLVDPDVYLEVEASSYRQPVELSVQQGDAIASVCLCVCQVITKGGITYKNTTWHRDCFTCSHCAKTLAGEKFTSQDDQPYCADCYGELFAKKCDSCMKPITGISSSVTAHCPFLWVGVIGWAELICDAVLNG